MARGGPKRPPSRRVGDGAESSKRQDRLVELFREHAAPLHARARTKLGNPVEAEDAVGEVFVRASRALSEGKSLRPAYLYLALDGICARRYRLGGRQEMYADVEVGARQEMCELAADHADRAADRYDANEQLVRIRARLSSRCDDVVELRLKGFGNGEIAEKLGISVKTVDAHWQKIRKVGLEERERERERAGLISHRMDDSFPPARDADYRRP